MLASTSSSSSSSPATSPATSVRARCGRVRRTARASATSRRHRRRRGCAVAAAPFDAVTTTFSPPPPPPSSSSLTRARVVELASTTIDMQSAETLVDAFEALPRDERIKLVERAVFGARGRDGDAEVLGMLSRRQDDGEGVHTEDTKELSSLSAELVREAPDVRVEAREPASEPTRSNDVGFTDEELDLREFGEPSSDGSSAWSDAALVEKWREVFGEDPPENSASGVEDILGADVGDDENIVARVGAAVARTSYAVERAWTKLVYRFGRQGAIVASGFVSVAVVVGFRALFGGQSPTVAVNSNDDEGETKANVSEPPVANDTSTTASDVIVEPKAQSSGVLWERKSDAEGDIERPPVASGAGILWTRKEAGEKAQRKSARERMGPPSSGTFDDRDRLEPPKQVLWTRKNDPELDDMDDMDDMDIDGNEYDVVEDVPVPRVRRNTARRPAASDLLDDNLEDLRAFRRKSENSDPR